MEKGDYGDGGDLTRNWLRNCAREANYIMIHLPIMLETNLLRSVGGIHRAVIGWMAGQVAPWFTRY